MTTHSAVAIAVSQCWPSRLAWLALLFGIVFSALGLSPDYVLGTGPYWQMLFGDIAKGEIGWFYYARDAWRYPLLVMQNYHQPEGSSIVLSDSLPLFAVPAKLLYSMFWSAGARPPIYTGLWVALCLVLQAVAASRVLRALRIIDPLPHIAGLVLFCYLPIVFLRFGQAALMGQFLILIALEAYLRAQREGGLSRRWWLVLCAMPAFVLLIHPYLAAMCSVLVAATILTQWREDRIALRGVLLRFSSIGLIALAVMLVGGFLSAASSDFGDYGLYSMNLLSPFVPFSNTLSGSLLGTTTPIISGTNQWEGGAYSGAGMMFLGLFALPALRDWRANLRRHFVLFALLIVVLMFAVSHRIGFGENELLTLPIPDFLLHAFSQFRGSGRFVWVVQYVLLAAIIAAVVARYPPRIAALLLCFAAIVQIVDVRPMQLGMRQLSASPMLATIDEAAWTRLIATHQRVFQFPSFECGGLFGREIAGTKFRELEFDWIAAQLDKPTNSAYLARFTKDCERERNDAIREHGQSGVLYLYRSTDLIGAYLVENGVDPSRCGLLDDVVVCSADQDLSNLRSAQQR